MLPALRCPAPPLSSHGAAGPAYLSTKDYAGVVAHAVTGYLAGTATGGTGGGTGRHTTGLKHRWTGLCAYEQGKGGEWGATKGSRALQCVLDGFGGSRRDS